MEIDHFIQLNWLRKDRPTCVVIIGDLICHVVTKVLPMFEEKMLNKKLFPPCVNSTIKNICISPSDYKNIIHNIDTSIFLCSSQLRDILEILYSMRSIKIWKQLQQHGNFSLEYEPEKKLLWYILPLRLMNTLKILILFIQVSYTNWK